MIRWNPRLMKAAVVLGSFVALAVASGAGARWH